MDKRDPPPTEEGWYALHDFRTVDWDAWRSAPERRRQRAIEEGVTYLESHAALDDVDDPGEFGGGATAVYTIVGHEADIMVLHLRESVAHLETAERQFEGTAFAAFTEQTSSYLSVTEASGYTERAREYFDGEVADDSGLAQYIQDRLHPDVPDAEHVCFYPMSKRRTPEQNWYDLPFEERAEHMARHGDIGRGYGGKVNQMIAGSVGLDDWEWGITLWADDPTDIKDLLYEMRFDPSSSKFAEFGPFYFGRRFPPADLDALLAGEHVPTDDAEQSHETADAHAGDAHHGHADTHDGTEGHHSGDADGHHAAEGEDAGHADDAAGGPPAGGDGDVDPADDTDIQSKLANLGLFPGQDYAEGTYGLVFYSEADAAALADEVDGLRGNFEHYDTHVLTTVRANEGRAAIASVWETESAADTAAGFLNDLSGVVEGYRGQLGEGDGTTEADTDDGDAIRGELEDLDIYAGQPHGEDVYALVLYSEADPEQVYAEVTDLRENFDHYDTHVKTAVYEDGAARATTEGDATDRTAVVSIWETQDAADTASDFLSDLPGIVGRAGDGSGFGTMGMFYTVKPEHREDFVERFGAVGEMLVDMDGHHDTALLVNREDENDMFIASQWRAREDAMAFFRSDDFADTVSWGQDVLADRPRHVFLA
ncbi:heme-binding protein [Halorientalis litorea]|uniref:heme-binding protein n=1 Tax=Halorientalis litorea TaxID=2931977 RepID=UPI001FF20F88|nr:heme-binding protein [Halorientalis litorea]